MNKRSFKNFIINLIIISISVAICLLIINFMLIKISSNQLLPRSLAGSLPNNLLTYYPDTYDNKNLKSYVAVLGDSVAQGGGDAYLSGKKDYSIIHHLHNSNNMNYLIFGRAGYGSISSVSNLVKQYKLSNHSYLFDDLNKPDSILFIFNESFNLHANITEYRKFKKNNEKINEYVLRRINKNIELNNLDYLKNSYPILPFLGKFYEYFEIMFNKIASAKNIEDIKLLVSSRLKKLFGKTVVLNDAPKNNLTWINSIKDHSNIKNIRPIQGAALHLTEDEIKTAIEIFFESLKYIQAWSDDKKIKIVYIPSAISSYMWNEPIVFYYRNNYAGSKTTNNKANNLNSTFIRKQIKNFSINNNIEFLDTTSEVFKNGENLVLHGPLDWGHFNDKGYKVISNFIIENLTK
jgi:hypothetical protein